MPWTKDQVARLIASTANGEDKVANMLRELAATQAAVENLSRSPNTVWFTQGFTPEQQVQRAAIINIARAILVQHRDDWFAALLNALNVPEP